MRHLRRLKRVLHDDQAGFSLAGIIVALALLGLVSALSVTALGDAYRSAGTLRTTIERQTDADTAIDLINDSLTYASSVEYADDTGLIVRVDEPGVCVQRGFLIATPANVLRLTTQSVTLPTGATCRSVTDQFATADQSFFIDGAFAPVEPVATNLVAPGTKSRFTYFGPSNVNLGDTPGDLCAITRVRTELTTLGGKDTENTSVGTGTVAARAFGAACP